MSAESGHSSFAAPRRMTRLTVLTYLLTSLGGQRGARDDTGRLRTVRTFLAPLTGARRLSKRKTKSTGASRVRHWAPSSVARRRRSHADAASSV